MDLVKARAVAGEGKAVTSDRPEWKRVAARFEALRRSSEKPAAGEPRSEASGASSCGVQRRVCRRWARLGIGSLGTIFFALSPRVLFTHNLARLKV
jgi:hypothetical protein